MRNAGNQEQTQSSSNDALRFQCCFGEVQQQAMPPVDGPQLGAIHGKVDVLPLGQCFVFQSHLSFSCVLGFLIKPFHPSGARNKKRPYPNHGPGESSPTFHRARAGVRGNVVKHFFGETGAQALRERDRRYSASRSALRYWLPLRNAVFLFEAAPSADRCRLLQGIGALGTAKN